MWPGLEQALKASQKDAPVLVSVAPPTSATSSSPSSPSKTKGKGSGSVKSTCSSNLNSSNDNNGTGVGKEVGMKRPPSEPNDSNSTGDEAKSTTAKRGRR